MDSMLCHLWRNGIEVQGAGGCGCMGWRFLTVTGLSIFCGEIWHNFTTCMRFFAKESNIDD